MRPSTSLGMDYLIFDKWLQSSISKINNYDLMTMRQEIYITLSNQQCWTIILKIKGLSCNCKLRIQRRTYRDFRIKNLMIYHLGRHQPILTGFVSSWL